MYKLNNGNAILPIKLSTLKCPINTSLVWSKSIEMIAIIFIMKLDILTLSIKKFAFYINSYYIPNNMEKWYKIMVKEYCIRFIV